MTWTSFHRRGETLRTVIAVADARRDGLLPMDLDGVAETFGDEVTLLGALQLRWHTRLAGRIERELLNHPMDLERGVVDAWCATAEEMPGVRAVLDHYRAEPSSVAMAEVMTKSAAKERILLAVMAGRVSAQDAVAARVGARIEEAARASYDAQRFAAACAATAATGTRGRPVGGHRSGGLLDRLKAALVAA